MAPTQGEIVTTTLEYRDKVLADNVKDNIPLLTRLNTKKKIKTVPGGEKIWQPVAYAENGNFQRYSGYDTLTNTPADVIGSAEYDMKLACVPVSISGEEQLKNGGEHAFYDLLESRLEVAEDTLMNNIDADLYSDGTADSGKQIDGLQIKVVEDPTTGTDGGINRATDTWWRNSKYDANADGGVAMSASNIQTYMQALWVLLCRNKDKTDLILAGDDAFKYYWSSLTSIQRIASENDVGKAGFETLKFNTADVVLAGGMGGNIDDTEKMYFLNTKYIHWRPYAKRNFVSFGGNRVPTDQDSLLKYLGVAGNLTMSGGKFQGVLFDSTV